MTNTTTTNTTGRTLFDPAAARARAERRAERARWYALGHALADPTNPCEGMRPEDVAASMLYFAFGSNLNIAQMNRRCPGSRVFGAATVKNWRLEFRGVADVVRKRGAKVRGGLWTVTADDVRKLDAYEGFPRLYTRREVVAIDATGTKRRAFLYVMRGGVISAPNPGYLGTILTGFRDFGLPIGPLAAAVDRAQRADDEDEYGPDADRSAWGLR